MLIHSVDILRDTRSLSDDLLRQWLITSDTVAVDRLKQAAVETSIKHNGLVIKARGLIEVTNFCVRNCFYCGIRAANQDIDRYRLSQQEILDTCKKGAELGFQTFVLQGGEDANCTTERVEELVGKIRTLYPDKAISLSLGERSKETYQRWFDAGANRYLLRHETADVSHYHRLHPQVMSYKNRVNCLKMLKSIGYETGTGMMVGSPYQTVDNLIADLRFIEELQPQMIGIGPFVSHKDTPFAKYQSGSVETTLRLIAILRLMHPEANIPATTSLGTLAKDGRELGVLAGANVVMPNLSPQKYRAKYALYDNKISTDLEAAESRALLEQKFLDLGYKLI
ncbi:MAG: [FeFe] hydrogenase H-cluster radical SAM maturase HydE [bacterium]